MGFVKRMQRRYCELIAVANLDFIVDATQFPLV